jgi:alkylation response protein AidB-like acyl-CoA dehydrogenase
MDVSYPPAVEEFRTTVRAFIAALLPPDWQGIGALEGEDLMSFLSSWRTALAERGYVAPAWPREYGGAGLSKLEHLVLMEEIAAAGLPGYVLNDNFSVKMIGNTLLHWGTEEQKRRFLPRIVSGEDVWCQGFSEPGAGSDLASLRTKARLDGDRWVINGQKIWTSAAMRSSWVFMLARTELDAGKHAGISMLLVPLEQAGIDIRPIRMSNGDDEFCEVYFTDAVTDADCLVGGRGEGWKVAGTLLTYERGEEAATLPVLFRAEFDRLAELARSRGMGDDAVLRQRLAAAYSQVEVLRFLGLRLLTRWLKGGAPGPESSVFKLIWSEYHQSVTELAMDVLGVDGLAPTGRPSPRAHRTDDPGAPNSTMSWASVFLNSRAGTIYAGTSEIQRNIIGESVLGLLREPRRSTS